jgi:hypothetical protein
VHRGRHLLRAKRGLTLERELDGLGARHNLSVTIS